MTTAAVAPDPVFVDTNILVYAAVPAFPLHADALARLDDFRRADVELWVSRQILREYLAALTRPQAFTPPIAPTTLVTDVNRFQAQFHIAEDGPVVTANLLTLLSTIPTGGRQVYDANIVATMQAHGLRRLLTHNTADFARFGAIIQLEPSITTP
jgi:predicted nucleic acid-binding protein